MRLSRLHLLVVPSVVVLSVVVLLVVAPSFAAGQPGRTGVSPVQPTPTTVFEDRLRARLLLWREHRVGPEHAAWLDLEIYRALGDDGALDKSSAAALCASKVEASTFRDLMERRPALSILWTEQTIETFRHHSTRGRTVEASISFDRFRAALDAHLESTDSPPSNGSSPDPARGTRTLLAAADLLWSMQRANLEDEALELYERALERAADGSPERQVALYWTGFLALRGGRPRPAARSLEAFLSGRPADDARMLHAVALLRSGRIDDARASFRALADDPSVDGWLRRLAHQQLVRSSGSDREPELGAALDEALASFPDDRGIRLRAYAAGRPLDPSSLLAPGLAESPRVLIEMPRRHELEPLLEQHQREVREALDLLPEALEGIDRSELKDGRRSIGDCRGASLEEIRRSDR